MEKTIEGDKQSVDELIMNICRLVRGVGGATAGHLASDFSGNLQEFLKAEKVRLENITNSNGKRLLTPEQINGIILAKGAYPQGKSVQETWVFFLGREFLKGQLRMITELNFTSFDINPLLAKALNLDNARKIIVFNVYQTVTRSIVTSWGDVVEKIAKFVGCKENDYIIEGKTGMNFDLIKNVEDIDYYIQIKSGPNTMNVGMVTSLNEVIENLESEKKQTKGILGMTYGTRSRISPQILGNLKDASKRMMVGRELWDFISGKKGFHKDLFTLLDESSRGLLDKSFVELIDDKINELEEYWKSHYPELSIDEVLEKYI